MKFQDIFKKEGLYRADSFSNGYCFEIKRNSIDNQLELYGLHFNSIDDILPKIEDVTVYEGLFNKTFFNVYNKSQLFS